MAKTKNNRLQGVTVPGGRVGTAFAEMQAIKRQVEAAQDRLHRLLQGYPRARHGKDWNPKADLLIQLRHARSLFSEAATMMETAPLHVDVPLKAVRK